MADVLEFPIRANPDLSKRQLANAWGKSIRTIERLTAEGMPSRLVYGRRRYRLRACEDWRNGRRENSRDAKA